MRKLAYNDFMKRKKRKVKLEDILPKYTLDDVLQTAEEDKAVQEEMALIDILIAELEKHIRRKLTKEEQHDLLEVVEECSAKDEGGYVIEYVPFDYAWMIYLIRKEEGSKDED
jgi:hypothetical protein